MSAEEEVPSCCPQYHQAVELIGRRWTGAIVAVLLDGGSQRFSELRTRVPGLSDRVLAQRMRELEAEAVVLRTVLPGRPLRVEYRLTEKGRDLEPVVRALERWGQRWAACSESPADPSEPGTPAHDLAPR